MKPIPYGRQSISEEDINTVIEVLKSDFLTQGPKIGAFEEEFAKYVGCKYAVAVANGTAALHLSALALGVNKDSRIITTPITFAASANCIRYCGGKVDFVDIDPVTGLLDMDRVRNLLEKSPLGTYQGIIPVDFAGFPLNLEVLRSLADEYGLWIIEDACHAPGGHFVDSRGVQQFCGNGNYADLAIFSFHPVKHIACGEGGMITTNSKELYEKLRILRTHGITKDANLMNENHGGWYYEMVDLGFNYRLTDIQAALGMSQLGRAVESVEKRTKIAEIYDKAFHGNEEIRILNPMAGRSQWSYQYGHAYHLYVILSNRRKELYDYLKKNNIHAQIHYIPLHLQPYYQQFGWSKGDFPMAESYYNECLSLPIFPSLDENEQQYIIENVLRFSENID
ncbi:UDP-4-amino-4,6-dideoxy-N-acetyl-beta-L-altrosamine transaminase [Fulvivirgaceae bacterium BMA12]|uniref:UDP-4-amino-4, 6-dideoxy-N-acetyl-beta-L-altrosamine transaminase n=1 Tax=Agaribacillus aureus TaxID=3051825 RepID=A0ABT8LD43_9BACT|nr:UDP-4-amino-4,6-dideoxy-N-acetyl-beta-L-altrosamine transaminase [Fulvivirgaceae bacterium BMA12]